MQESIAGAYTIFKQFFDGFSCNLVTNFLEFIQKFYMKLLLQFLDLIFAKENFNGCFKIKKKSEKEM